MLRAWFSIQKAIRWKKKYNLEELSALLASRKQSTRPWTIEEANQAWRDVQKAKKFILRRTACLEESLALFLLATSYGCHVTWCTGIRTAPFTSHAWVEVEGTALQEDVSEYRKLLVV